MQPPVTHQPVQPPQRGYRVPDIANDNPDSEAPSQGLYGELVPPVESPRPDWDWPADTERRRR